MKTTIIVFVMSSLLCSACAKFPANMLQQNNLSSQVLVERVEDNGVLNIRSVELLFDDQKILCLCGGQAASVFLEPGKHFVQAVSPDPYNPNSTNEWRTKVIRFTTKAGDVKRFEVCGAGHDSVYTHWQIQDTGNDTSRTTPSTERR